MQPGQSYQERTRETESTIRDLVLVGRASPDLTFRSMQKVAAFGVLREWIETTEELGDAPQSHSSDRGRLMALVNTTMLDL